MKIGWTCVFYCWILLLLLCARIINVSYFLPIFFPSHHFSLYLLIISLSLWQLFTSHLSSAWSRGSFFFGNMLSCERMIRCLINRLISCTTFLIAYYRGKIIQRHFSLLCGIIYDWVIKCFICSSSAC